MLILSRKVVEAIYIGDNVSVRVVRIEGGHVKLGFCAPKSTKILREEILHCDQVQDMQPETTDKVTYGS